MSKYKVPHILLTEGNPRQRAEHACGEIANCKIEDKCSECIFEFKNWTPEREAAFLEWERGQQQ